MEWGLGNQAIGDRNAENTCGTSGDSKKEDIPVKTRRFTEGIFSTLGDERRDIVIYPEQKLTVHMLAMVTYQ